MLHVLSTFPHLSVYFIILDECSVSKMIVRVKQRLFSSLCAFIQCNKFMFCFFMILYVIIILENYYV